MFKTSVLQCLHTWAIKNVVFSRVLGVMAPMGRLVMCLGCPGRQNRPKRIPTDSISMLRVDICFAKKRNPEQVVSQVAFSTFFCCFLEGPTLGPLAPAQSKHNFSCSAWPLKGFRFLIAFCTHFWYIWHRNPLKRHFKIELDNKSCTNVCVLFSLSCWHPFGHLMVRFFSPLGRACPQKTRFSQAWGPRLAKSGVSPCLGPLALQKYCVFLSRAPRATQKTTIQHACPWLGAPGQPKKGPSSLTLNLDQNLTNLRAQKTKDRPPPLGHPPRRSGRSPLG